LSVGEGAGFGERFDVGEVAVGEGGEGHCVGMSCCFVWHSPIVCRKCVGRTNFERARLSTCEEAPHPDPLPTGTWGEGKRFC
jgi:hypothetical protein